MYAIVWAEELGKLLAELNITVLTGGCTGFPKVVVESAKKSGGTCVAYYPNESLSEVIEKREAYNNHDPYYYASHKFHNGFTHRSLTMLYDADLVLAFNGRVGTLSECMIAIDENIPTIICTGLGGICDSLEDIICKANPTYITKATFVSCKIN
jgi:uncharacterized protein (TIGR00725 family)